MANIEQNSIVGRLVIRVGRDSLSFSTVEGTGQVMYEPFALNSSISMAANLREALRTVPLLQSRPSRVLVLVDTPLLLVPNDVFQEEDQTELYRHTFTHQDQQTVLHAVLPDLNSVAVFSIQKDLKTVITDAYGASVRFMPVTASVWHHLYQRSFTGQHQKLYGYLHDRRLEVFSFGQNRFRFSNTFAVNNPNDAIYYLLAVWKQLGFEADHDELHLVGQLPDEEALKAELQRFVKRVFVINPVGEFNRAAVTQIAGIPYDLVTLYMKRS